MTPALRQLVDIGVNLAHDSFDPDRAAVIDRARTSGVSRMIVTGSTLESSRRAAELAASDECLFATAGVHPHHAEEITPDHAPALTDLARRAGVVAIGECGLDFFRDFSPRDVQEEAFRLQLELAMDLGMPVFLHQRDAHDRFLAILDECGSRRPAGVAHCFTGDAAELAAYLDRGLYVGITGWICDERRGQALRAAVARLPMDRLLVETDAPYLLPRDLDPKPRSRRNEPAYLPHVVRVLARWMDRPADEIAAASTRNAEVLFRLSDSQKYV